MNDEIRQAIETIKEQQPIEIDLNWYQGTIELVDIKQYIRANINSASRSFVAIGYYLKYVRDNELYKEDDYSGISEFAKAEFGISPAQASKFMSINDRFSVDGNSPILLEQYKDFTSSKLSEMLYLTDEQLEQVSIASTKAEIRQIGKPVKEEVETISFSPAKTEPEATKITEDEFIIGFYRHMYDHQKQLTKERKTEQLRLELIRIYGKRFERTNCILEGWTSCYPDKVVFRQKGNYAEQMQLTWGKYVSRLFRLIDEGRLVVEDISETVNDIPETVNDELDFVDSEPEILNDVDESDIPERGCSNCMYDDMDPTEYHRRHLDKTIEFPCNSCDDKLNHWEPETDGLILDCFSQEEGWHKEIIAGEPDLVETVDADIIQTDPEDAEGGEETYSYEKYSLSDVKDEYSRLMEYVEAFREDNSTAPGRRKAKMRLDAIILLDKKMRLSIDANKFEPEQPELPILRNNDQRKEFIDAYDTWPVWIETKDTGERYYRYDFDNGDSIVVKVYYCKIFNYKATNLDYEDRFSDGWGKEEYYLLETGKYFKDCETNKSSLIEYLKDLQKKGV